MPYHLLCIFVSYFLLQASTPAAQDPSEKIYSTDNEHFEIISNDPISLSWMARLSEEIAHDVIHISGFHEAAIQRKIIVELQPSATTDLRESYQIDLDPRGFLRLGIRWSTQLTIDIAIQALCDAFLQRYRYNQLGVRQSSQSSRWLQTALQQWLYVRRFPAERLSFHHHLKQPPVFSLEESLTAAKSGSVPKELRWECLALLELIRQNSTSKKSFQATLIHYLATRSLKSQLAKTFPEITHQQLDTWWLEKRKDLSIPVPLLCESMKVSRHWLRELATFYSLLDHADQTIDLKQLWQERKQPIRQQRVRARARILQRRLQTVNPAYFNAASALNSLFISVLDGESRAQFTHHLLEFRSLMDDAEDLELLVEKKLKDSPINESASDQ